jgi:hypothetical protein
MHRVVFAVLALASVALAEPPPQPLHAGQWSFTTTTNMDDHPMGAPRASTRCITPEDAKDPMKAVQHPEGCNPINEKASGKNVTWSMACHIRGGTQTGNGSITFSSDAVTTDATISMNDPKAGKHVMQMHTEGKRTGDCP